MEIKQNNPFRQPHRQPHRQSLITIAFSRWQSRRYGRSKKMNTALPQVALDSRLEGKAEDDPPCTRLQHQHHCQIPSVGDSMASPAPAAATPIQQHEAPSINSIIRQHNRVRLYVPPLKWNMQHLELLGCRFVSEKPRKKRRVSASEQKTRSGSATRRQHHGEGTALSNEAAVRMASGHLIHARTNSFKTLAIRELLEDYGTNRYAKQVAPGDLL